MNAHHLLENLAKGDRERHDQLTHLRLCGTPLGLIRYIVRRSRLSLVMRVVYRVAILLEIALLHRYLGMVTASFFAALYLAFFLFRELFGGLAQSAKVELALPREAGKERSSHTRALATLALIPLGAAFFSVGVFSASLCLDIYGWKLLGVGIWCFLFPFEITAQSVWTIAYGRTRIRPYIIPQCIALIIPVAALVVTHQSCGIVGFLLAVLVSRGLQEAVLLIQGIKVLKERQILSFTGHELRQGMRELKTASKESFITRHTLILIPWAAYQLSVIFLLSSYNDSLWLPYFYTGSFATLLMYPLTRCIAVLTPDFISSLRAGDVLEGRRLLRAMKVSIPAIIALELCLLTGLLVAGPNPIVGGSADSFSLHIASVLLALLGQGGFLASVRVARSAAADHVVSRYSVLAVGLILLPLQLLSIHYGRPNLSFIFALEALILLPLWVYMVRKVVVENSRIFSSLPLSNYSPACKPRCRFIAILDQDLTRAGSVQSLLTMLYRSVDEEISVVRLSGDIYILEIHGSEEPSHYQKLMRLKFSPWIRALVLVPSDVSGEMLTKVLLNTITSLKINVPELALLQEVMSSQIFEKISRITLPTPHALCSLAGITRELPSLSFTERGRVPTAGMSLDELKDGARISRRWAREPQLLPIKITSGALFVWEGSPNTLFNTKSLSAEEKRRLVVVCTAMALSSINSRSHLHDIERVPPQSEGLLSSCRLSSLALLVGLLYSLPCSAAPASTIVIEAPQILSSISCPEDSANTLLIREERKLFKVQFEHFVSSPIISSRLVCRKFLEDAAAHLQTSENPVLSLDISPLDETDAASKVGSWYRFTNTQLFDLCVEIGYCTPPPFSFKTPRTEIADCRPQRTLGSVWEEIKPKLFVPHYKKIDRVKVTLSPPNSLSSEALSMIRPHSRDALMGATMSVGSATLKGLIDQFGAHNDNLILGFDPTAYFLEGGILNLPDLLRNQSALTMIPMTSGVNFRGAFHWKGFTRNGEKRAIISSMNMTSPDFPPFTEAHFEFDDQRVVDEVHSLYSRALYEQCERISDFDCLVDFHFKDKQLRNAWKDLAHSSCEKVLLTSVVPPTSKSYFMQPQDTDIEQLLREEIKDAKKEIIILSQRLSLPAVIRELATAEDRGVSVYPYLAEGHSEVLSQLKRVQLFDTSSRRDRFLAPHMKVIVIDRKRMIFGTGNFTPSGTSESRELFAVTEDPAAIETMLQVASSFEHFTAENGGVQFTDASVNEPFVVLRGLLAENLKAPDRDKLLSSYTTEVPGRGSAKYRKVEQRGTALLKRCNLGAIKFIAEEDFLSCVRTQSDGSV